MCEGVAPARPGVGGVGVGSRIESAASVGPGSGAGVGIESSAIVAAVCIYWQGVGVDRYRERLRPAVVELAIGAGRDAGRYKVNDYLVSVGLIDFQPFPVDVAAFALQDKHLQKVRRVPLLCLLEGLGDGLSLQTVNSYLQGGLDRLVKFLVVPSPPGDRACGRPGHLCGVAHNRDTFQLSKEFPAFFLAAPP